MSDNRPMVYKEGDRWVFRASSIGRSMRCLVAAMNGHTTLPAPDYLMKAARAGDKAEADVKTLLRDQSYVIGGEQNEIELVVNDQAVVRGHADAGVVIKPGTDAVFMLEVKSMSDTVFRKWLRWGWERFRTYEWQLASYMHMTQLPALYVVINRDTKEMWEQEIIKPPVELEVIQAHVAGAVAAHEGGVMPVCNVKPEYQCPYEYLCDITPPLFEELEGGSADALNTVAEEYDTVRVTMKALEERKKSLQQDMKLTMGDRERVETDNWRISIVKQKRRRLDEKALREELGDRLAEFYTEAEYSFPRITRKGD